MCTCDVLCYYQGDSSNVCCLRADWWCAGCKQSVHFANSSQHFTISHERSSDDDLVHCYGLSLIEMDYSEIVFMLVYASGHVVHSHFLCCSTKVLFSDIR